MRFNERVGETAVNNQGIKMRIIVYRSSKSIDVQFDDGTIIKDRTYQEFKGGHIHNPNGKAKNVKDRTGEVGINNQGLKMRIIAYRSSNNVDIQFEDGAITYGKSYYAFKKGSIAHPSRY